jgi:hypothetical protein
MEIRKLFHVKVTFKEECFKRSIAADISSIGDGRATLSAVAAPTKPSLG